MGRPRFSRFKMTSRIRRTSMSIGRATVKSRVFLGKPATSASLEFDAGGSASAGFDADDPLAPKAGDSIPLRVCDYCAWLLQRIDGFPAFSPYWPEAKRDEAVSALAVFLSRYGPRIQPYEDTRSSRLRWGGDIEARLAFPRLDHPATPAEVR